MPLLCPCSDSVFRYKGQTNRLALAGFANKKKLLINKVVADAIAVLNRELDIVVSRFLLLYKNKTTYRSDRIAQVYLTVNIHNFYEVRVSAFSLLRCFSQSRSGRSGVCVIPFVFFLRLPLCLPITRRSLYVMRGSEAKICLPIFSQF